MVRSRTLIWLLALLAVRCTTEAAPPASEPNVARPLPPPFVFPEQNTVVGQHLNWVLSNLNEKRGQVAVADVRTHFSPAALKSASAEQLGLMFYTLSRDLGPLTMSRTLNYPGHGELIAALGKTRDQENIKILISIDPKDQKINNLLFQNADNPKKASSYQQIDEALRMVAPASQILVAEITDAGCEPLHDLNPGEVFPIGTNRQLFVLQDLTAAVVEGKVAWGEVLPGSHDAVDKLAAKMTAQNSFEAEDILRRKLATVDLLQRLVDNKDRRENESAIALCKVMAQLASEASRFSLAAPVLEILAQTPSDGVSINRRTYSYVGAKRSISPDALTLTWLLQRQDRRMFFVTLSAKGVANRLDDAILEIATALVQLVGASP